MWGMENWRPIPNYEGFYEACDDGRIRRVGKSELSPRAVGAGYRGVHLSKDNVQVQAGVHRLVWAAFNGPIPAKMWINHKSGIKTDNSLGNLELSTPSENQKHSYEVLKRKRSSMAGSVHPKTHLTEADVLALRAEYDTDRTRAKRDELAVKYGVACDTVKRIVYRTSWRHI